jgi:MoxR-like ATPase
MDTRDKFKAAEQDLRTHFRKRDSVIRGLFISVLARQHAVIIGEPGDGKTKLSTDFFRLFTDSQFAHFGLHKGSTSDDLFGGPDIVALQNGIDKRNTKGRLLEVNFALLDEPDKASEGTLNSLLVPLSDFVFETAPLPLQCAVYCGNNLPHELRGQRNGKPLPVRQGEDSLLAFFDRFALKFVVESIEPGNEDWRSVVFRRITDTPYTSSLSLDDLANAREQVAKVHIPESVEQFIEEFAGVLRRGNGKPNSTVKVSTRRWAQVPGLLRAAAWLEGRDEVSTQDTSLLVDILWTTPDQRKAIREALLDCGSPIVRDCAATIDKVAEAVLALSERRLSTGAGADGYHIHTTAAEVNPRLAVGVAEVLLRFIDKTGGDLRNAITPDLSADDLAAVEDSLQTLRNFRKQVLEEFRKRIA